MDAIWQQQIDKVKDGMIRIIDDIMEFPFDWINEELFRISHLTLTYDHVHEGLISLSNITLRDLRKRLLNRYDYHLTNEPFNVNISNKKTSETNQEDESPLSSDFSYSESS